MMYCQSASQRSSSGFQDRAEQLPGLDRGCQVGLERLHLPWRIFAAVDGVAEMVDRHPGAGLGQLFGDSLADALAGPGDQGVLALKIDIKHDASHKIKSILSLQDEPVDLALFVMFALVLKIPHQGMDGEYAVHDSSCLRS
jgi:hypothetical protein